MRLSVIIPMYNSGPFIEKCLESCISQDIGKDDYEIIVVNDGSTDQGPGIVEGIVDDIRSEGLSVRMVSQANSGLSMARNKGLSQARGDYVWFVDSDDFLEKNCFGEMLSEVAGNDILAFGMRNILPDGRVESVFSYPRKDHLTGPEFFMKVNERLKLCSPLYLFRRSLLTDNGLSFFPGIYHEDAEFTPKAVCLAESVVVSPRIPYVRLVHEGSIMNTVNPRRPLDIVKVIGLLDEFRNKMAPDTSMNRAFNSLMANLANYACKLSDQTSVDSRKEFSESLSSISSLIPGALRGSLQLKYRIEGLLLPLFGGNLPAVHRFLMRFK